MDKIRIRELKTGGQNTPLNCNIPKELKQIHSVLENCILTASLDCKEISQVLLQNGTSFIRLHIITPMRSIDRGEQVHTDDSNNRELVNELGFKGITMTSFSNHRVAI